MKKVVCLTLALALILSFSTMALAQDKLNVSISYYDNPTYPFNPNWSTYQFVADYAGLNIEWQPYPLSEYVTKVTTVLAGGNAPDVLTVIDSTNSTYASFAVSGTLLPVSDYLDCFPNFMARIEEFGLEESLKSKYSLDGKLYMLPKLTDVTVCNAGMLIRTDLLEEYGLEKPTSYDELYNVLTVFKQHNPDIYPMTCLTMPLYMYLYSMPSWGLSLGSYNADGSWVLSYNYDEGTYFAGATSDAFRDYLRYFNKLYVEGLLDPEWVATPSDRWTTKLATGEALASFGFYDQIGSIVSNSDIEGFAIDMLVPMEGPAGAYTRYVGRLADGIAFPSSVTKRADYEDVLRAVDTLFYANETSTVFAAGLEGEAYDVIDGQVIFKDELVNDPNGLFKALQINYGCSTTGTQMIWRKSLELAKKDAHYTELNNAVDAMDGAIPDLPVLPKFDEDDQEEVSLLIARLSDAFDVWSVEFITGAASIDNDWDTYVAELESKGIGTLLEMYNNAIANQ